MGVWSVALYSSDFALDLRSTISAVLRLPFNEEQLIDAICEAEPQSAENPDDEDYSTFWLVLADQLAKRGLPATRAREIALRIIDSGADLASLEKRGAQAADLKKRSAVLQELRTRLVTAQPVTRPRAVLKKPQPFLMEVGDVVCYPTSHGKVINAYAKPEQLVKPNTPLFWNHDGYGAFVVVNRGRAFDYLTWYRYVKLAKAMPEIPAIGALRNEELLWVLSLGGTCSATHFKRMRLEKLGTLAVDRTKLLNVFPAMRPSHKLAISDISICNHLDAAPSLMSYSLAPPGTPERERRGRNLTLLGIAQILSD